MEPISREEAFELLESVPVAHLGMIEMGEPYVTPMSFVMDGDRILFRTMAGRKLNALKASPQVCVEVSSYDEESGDWVSVIVKGVATEVDDDSIKQNIVSKLFQKYEKVMGSPLGQGAGLHPLGGLPHVIAVKIDDVTGLSSGRGWSRRSKPGRL